MAIEFNCPFCGTFYRLRDDLAGKRATCKNADCRKVIPVPQPTPPTAAPPVDVEAAAMSALADEPAKANGAVSERTIAVKCTACDHQWTEPFTKAGKNVLCPECRHRVKVPEPKGEMHDDWRRANTRLPSLAKENFEKPKDVQDAGNSVLVGGEALRKAGAIKEDFEPIPLSRKLLLVGVPLLLVAGIAAGGYYWIKKGRAAKENTLMAEALSEFDTAEEKPPPAEAPLFSAVLRIAAGEYAARLDSPEKLKEALDHFAKAREELRQAPQKDDPRKPSTVGERNALLGELAIATLALGGTDEQVKDQKRYRWMPEAPGGRATRINEKTFNVHGELQRTLGVLKPAEFDAKADAARRLTRELVKRGQTELVGHLPEMLFTEAEQSEGKAIIALEVLRADSSSDFPRRVAEELKVGVTAGQVPTPASAQTLWSALTPPVTGTPTVTGTPSPSGEVSEPTRVAYCGLYVLQNDPAKALALARRPGTPQGQLRALALVADWSADPGPALDAALAVIRDNSRKVDVTLPGPPVARLMQIAAAAGKPDLVKELALGIPDFGLRDWAKADAVRLRLTPANKEQADDNWVELPEDPKKLRAAHAWGRLAVARHNAKLSGSLGDVQKYITWPKGTLHPFALAGVALGVQDGK